MIDFHQLKEIIEKHNSFVITTHVNPDADAIGSEIAVYNVLKKLGKEAAILNHSETPYYLEFLDQGNVIAKYERKIHDQLLDETEVILFLDLNQLNRVRSLEDKIKQIKKVRVCIDHHQNPEDFVDFSIIDTKYSSTGEIIFDFIKETNLVELDYEIALPLYAAIMTDTGSFRFERTTPKVHRIAAELIELGVAPPDVNDKIFDQSRASKIMLLGKAISLIKIDETEKIAYMVITQEMMKQTGAEESEVDGFVNFCLSIENIEIGLLFFELKNGLKVSFRSKRDIPVNKLAAEFGGGGHTNAAGTRLVDVQLDEYIEKVVKAARKYLE